MRAAVTGGSGFVGGHIVDRLMAEGFAVVCLVRPTSDTARLRSLGATVRVAPLADRAALEAALGDVDIVIHAAGLTRARSAGPYLRVNAAGTRTVLAAAAAANPSLRRFVYVSSLAAVGPNPGDAPLDETAVPRPRGGYGASKLAGERVAAEYASRIPVTVVRPPVVYGPRDLNFLPMFRSARRWGIAPVAGSPEKLISTVYAPDLAAGIVRAGTAPRAAGETYFITGTINTCADIVSAVGAALDTDLKPLRLPETAVRLAGEIGETWWRLTGRSTIISRRKVRDMLQDRWTCTGEKAARELEFRPAVEPAEGMRKTAEWYAAAGLIPPLRS